MDPLRHATPPERAAIAAATTAYAEAVANKSARETDHKNAAARVQTLVRRAADLAADIEVVKIIRDRGAAFDAQRETMSDAARSRASAILERQRARAAALLAGHEVPAEHGLEQLLDEYRRLQGDVTLTRDLSIEMAQAVNEAVRIWGVRRGELATALSRPLRRRVHEALDAVRDELGQLASLVQAGAEPFGMLPYPQGIVIKTEFLVPGAAVTATVNTAAVEALLLSLVAGTTDAKKAA
jgi:hypothetical protein